MELASGLGMKAYIHFSVLGSHQTQTYGGPLHAATVSMSSYVHIYLEGLIAWSSSCPSAFQNLPIFSSLGFLSPEGEGIDGDPFRLSIQGVLLCIHYCPGVTLCMCSISCRRRCF